jgi:hypothetical protein
MLRSARKKKGTTKYDPVELNDRLVTFPMEARSTDKSAGEWLQISTMTVRRDRKKLFLDVT